MCTECEQKLAGCRALVGSSMLSGMHGVHAVDLAPCTHPWGRPKIAPVAFPRQAFCTALHLHKAAMLCREVLYMSGVRAAAGVLQAFTCDLAAHASANMRPARLPGTCFVVMLALDM